MAKKNPLMIQLNSGQADAIMMAVLREAMRNAMDDIKNKPKFAGPEAVEFVKAAKTVLNWFSIGEPFK